MTGVIGDGEQDPAAALSERSVGRVVKLLLASQAIVVVGLLADVTQLAGTGAFESVVSGRALRWVFVALSVALVLLLVRAVVRAGQEAAALRDQIVRVQKNLERERKCELSLTRRFGRIMQAILLDDIRAPSERDILEPLLNELSRRLVDGGISYKLGVVRPNEDGTFSMLAERGMDPTSIDALERRANWKGRESFFADVVNSDDDSQYFVFQSGTGNYLDLQKEKGRGERPTSSRFHFIVPLRDPLVYTDFPRGCIGLVSVGVPREASFLPAQQRELYDLISPVVRCIEVALLTVDRRSARKGHEAAAGSGDATSKAPSVG